jgi:putative lipoic acid-binding regulatory protein
MKSDLESLLEFPCKFPIKAMGRNADDFQTVVTTLVFRHAELFSGEEVRVQPSAEGNFLSVTVTIEAQSRA